MKELTEHGLKETVIQNLKDVGCSQNTIECYIACLNCDKKAELLKRLEQYRNSRFLAQSA